MWQGRFYSCPLDDAHLWIALRYVELNPVRAKLVAEASAWPWSSAAVHCEEHEAPTWLDLEKSSKRWSAPSWRKYLRSGELEDEIAAIRQCTHTGRPLGAADFVHFLEQATQRRLLPEKGARIHKTSVDGGEKMLPFEA